jgi:[NiFe] hydrogenase small subunit
VQAALATGLRQPVLWLHFAECTGCTESVLRTTSPYFDDLILNTISLEYHETLMVESGQGSEDLRAQVLSKYAGDFLCVVEGSIPTAANGAYGTVGAQTMYAIAAEVLPKAKAIIAIGSCASNGGVASASPNPAGVCGVTDAFPSLTVPVINCPGCPPNPVNFIAIIADYLLKGTTPPLDSNKRPTFAYGKTVHQQCGLLGTANCLQSQGCRGISTFHNCPKVKFNDGTSYCQQAGHVCIACSEVGCWDSSAYWSPPFWKSYPVKVDSTKAGITYGGDPNGIISTNTGPDGGAGDAGGNVDAGSGGGSGSGGSGSGGRSGSGGSGSGGSGSGGRSSSGGSGSGGSGSGGSGSGGSGSGGRSGSGGSGSGGRSGSGGSGFGGTSQGSSGSGGSSSTGGAFGTGGRAGTGGTSGHGGATSPSTAQSAGCGCDVGAGRAQSLGTVGTLAALGAIATRILRSKTLAADAKGDACPASSSTPSPESKDT